jgi:dihydrofolate reductase
MKLTTNTNISVDGVMQGLGGPDEDRRGGFERGGWVTDMFDLEAMAALDEIYGRADAFLFGRRTYKIFARSWGSIEEMRAQPIGVALNTRPKYVASTRPLDEEWADTTLLSGDAAAAIRALKAAPGGELQLPGSGALVRWLLENDLVDEIILFTVPVVVGQGTRLFPQDGPQKALELVGSRSTPAGVTIHAYRPAGSPQSTAASWARG